MFVGDGVVDDVRAVGVEEAFHAEAVFHVGHNEFDLPEEVVKFFVVFYLELEVVEGGFGLVDEDDARWGVAEDLSCDFAAYASGGSGDHDDFIFEFADHVFAVELDGVAFEEFFDFHAAQLL